MCQLCKLKTIAERSRWPGPLVEHVDELKGLLRTAHCDATNLSVRRDLARKAATKAEMSSIIAGIKVQNATEPTGSDAAQMNNAEDHEMQDVPAPDGHEAVQSPQTITMPDHTLSDTTRQASAHSTQASIASDASPSTAVAAKERANFISVVLPTPADIKSSKVSLTATVEAKPDIIAARERLTLTIEMLNTALEVVESERKDWWNSEPKRKQRQQWIETANYTNLHRLQALNNTCIGMINDIEATIGQFVRWVVE